MFGELIGAWAAAVWRQMGAPARVQSGRARSRPRHADGRCAARRARRCRIFAPPSRCIWSRRARCCARAGSRRSRSPTCRSPGIDAHRRRSGRPADRDRQRVRRRAADRPVREGPRRLARAHGRHRRRPARPSSVAPDPTARAIAPSGRAGRRDPGTAPRPADRAAGAAHRAAWRRGADHRLRPRREPRSATRCRPCAATRSPIRSPIPARPISPRRSISPRSRARRGAQGAAPHGPLAQGDFLRRLGIEERAARLKANATPQQAADIDAALARLTAPDQMGELFKVLAIADPKLGALPGFDSRVRPSFRPSEARAGIHDHRRCDLARFVVMDSGLAASRRPE